MNKTIIFDSGPIISISMNHLLWILDPLKKHCKGKFYITETVKKELVDRPFHIKKFKFEAIQVLHNIEKNVIQVVSHEKVKDKTEELLDLANHCFSTGGNYISIVHSAEMEVLALALYMNADAIVIDERTTRVLVENPSRLTEILENKLNIKIDVNTENLEKLKDEISELRVIRSTEIVTIAYEIGLLDKFILRIPNARKNLLEAVLWGVKLDGCAVTRRDIDTIVKIETKE